MDGFTYNANFQTYQNRIMCVIENDTIYQLDNLGKNPIGIITKTYDDLNSVTTEYYNKLVEIGVLVPEKTTEELLVETQKALIESQNVNKEMLELLKNLKGEGEVGNEPRDDCESVTIVTS